MKVAHDGQVEQIPEKARQGTGHRMHPQKRSQHGQRERGGKHQGEQRGEGKKPGSGADERLKSGRQNHLQTLKAREALKEQGLEEKGDAPQLGRRPRGSGSLSRHSAAGSELIQRKAGPGLQLVWGLASSPVPSPLSGRCLPEAVTARLSSPGPGATHPGVESWPLLPC